MKRRTTFRAALLVAGLAACDRFQTPAQRAEAARRDSLARDSVARVAALAAADSLHTRSPLGEMSLAVPLSSVGGLTLTNDGRLLLADAESGNVSEVDPANGTVIKTFRLGREPVHDEFVGIATTENGDVFELSRDGAVYHFFEGGDGSRVEFLKHDTRLGAVCAFGGAAFNKERNALLLACNAMKHASDSLALFWWRLDTREDRTSEFYVANPSTMHPDELMVDPQTGNYVLMDAGASAFFAMTPEGHTAFVASGPPGIGSARGAVIMRNGELLVTKQRAGSVSLVRYRWR